MLELLLGVSSAFTLIPFLLFYKVSSYCPFSQHHFVVFGMSSSRVVVRVARLG
jgi:hypothetical protein